jgi:hypothetical protein
MRHEAIAEITKRPADKIRFMDGEVMQGPLHFQSQPTTPQTNVWMVYRRDTSGKAHSHKYIDGDKVVVIDPSNDDPIVQNTNV